MLGEKYEMICEEIEGAMQGIRGKFETSPEHYEKMAVRELRICIREIFKKHTSEKYRRLTEGDSKMFK